MAPARNCSASLCVVLASLLFSFLLAGCSQTQPGKITEPLVSHSSVHGGQQPVIGATLTLYAVGTNGDGSPSTSLMTAPVTSDANGNFNLTGAYTCPTPSTLVYVVAKGGNPGLSPGTNNTAIALMAALGPCGNLAPSTFITINELTTVAAIWPLAPYMSSFGSIGSGPADPALAGAFTLASQYVNTTTGTAPGLNVPPGTMVPVAELNTLANILSSCVNSAGGVAGDGSACGTLFAAATPSGGTAPVEVAGAGLNIANNPTANIAALYALVTPTAPFQPTLPVAPAAWTVQLLAPAGVLLSPSALIFPATYPGIPPPPQTVTVTNAGATAVGLGWGLGGLNSGDFTIIYPPTINNCPGYLIPGQVCTLQVSFNPAGVGTRSALFTIESSAPNSPQVIALSGQGLAASGGPLTLSPASLTFTETGIPQNFIVTNNGSSSVSIGNISNNNSGFFTQTSNCGTMLAAQSICTISVQTNRLSQTAASGLLTMINSSTSGTLTAQLNVPAMQLNLIANPLVFGDLALGVRSLPQYVQFYAPIGSNASLPQLSASITGPNAGDFTIVSGPPEDLFGCTVIITAINPTDCAYDVVFTPTSVGVRTATLTTNYGNAALSGNGIPAGPSFTMSAYPVSGSIVGSSSPPATITVANNGSTQLTLQPSVTGANASDFAVTNQCPTPLNSSALSCSLTVVFTPSAVGPRIATLTLTDTVSGVSRSISLTGQASPTIPAISPASLTFGNTQIGSVSAQQIVTVTQPNGDPMTTRPLDGSTSEFVVSSGTCAQQTPCQITVSFQPKTTGLQSARFFVVDTLSGEAVILSLQGSGGIATLSLSTTSLSFAARNQGTTSIPQTITLTNTGNTDLLLSTLTFNGANAGDFVIEGNTCGNGVVAGQSCTVSVSFSPTASGLRNANLVIQSNAATSPDMVQLSGTGN